MPPGPRTPHQFGGDWTARKLEILGKYLRAYSVALHDKPSAASPFRKAFIDGFAGTGNRTPTRGLDETAGAPGQVALFDLEPSDSEAAPLLDGSARVALQVTPPFDRYVFIERSIERCNELESLRGDFPELRNRILVRQGDANVEIRAMAAKDWSGSRAVLFLDPYGMQVEWATLVAVAQTKAIDLWLLFPLGIGVNRLLTRSGKIPPSWRARLDILLGDQGWYEDFYRLESDTDLFGDKNERLVKASMQAIGQRFVARLKTIFSGVAEAPALLRNSTNNPMYLLCFACANERGAKPALKIANDLLRKIS